MSCSQHQFRLSEFLDGELSPSDAAVLAEHLRSCRECSDHFAELEMLRQVLSTPARMPESSVRQLRVQLQRAQLGWKVIVAEWLDSIGTSWRDRDRPALRYKLCAIPLTVGFFMLLLMQFPQMQFHEWTYPVFARTKAAYPTTAVHPVMVQVFQRNNEINGLMDTAWKTPYEDSLSLVAEIQPGGSARIGNILEYPKNEQLLNAVDLTLRNSRFEIRDTSRDSFVIYSFQKVDVYQ